VVWVGCFGWWFFWGGGGSEGDWSSGMIPV
jgi:hypothetical protein